MGETPVKESGNPPMADEPTWAQALAYPLACAGAIAGAGVGAIIARMAAGAGFYAIIAVGICTGFGALLVARRGGWGVALIAVVVSLAASLWTEWWLYPFIADDSLRYFVMHLGDLRGFSLLIHAVGALAAGYIAFRR